MTQERALSKNVSLYPAHLAYIRDYSAELGLHGERTDSTTLQRIIEEWAEQRALLALLTPASLAALRRQLAATQ